MSASGLHLFLLAALLAVGTSSANDEQWGYPDMERDEAFPKWGGLCDSGTHQSPIDFNLDEVLKGVFHKLDFDDYKVPQRNVSIVNNGHTIQLSGFPVEMELEGGPLSDEYVVEQIHLHWGSEHTINKKRYPLEVHIVHRNRRYPNMTMAGKFPDGITVVGVLYHISHERNDGIQLIIDNLDAVKSYKQLNKPAHMKKAFITRDLFPKVDGYLTYAGSLTTPNCAEAVTWIVMHKTFPVTLEQVNHFKEVEFAEHKALRNNYRFIQKTNSRPVTIVLEEDDYDSDDASRPIVSFGGIVLLVIMGKYLQ